MATDLILGKSNRTWSRGVALSGDDVKARTPSKFWSWVGLTLLAGVGIYFVGGTVLSDTLRDLKKK